MHPISSRPCWAHTLPSSGQSKGCALRLPLMSNVRPHDAHLRRTTDKNRESPIQSFCDSTQVPHRIRPMSRRQTIDQDNPGDAHLDASRRKTDPARGTTRYATRSTRRINGSSKEVSGVVQLSNDQTTKHTSTNSAASFRVPVFRLDSCGTLDDPLDVVCGVPP